MKKIVIMLLVAVFAVSARAESFPALQVLSYTNSGVTLIAEKTLDGELSIMADQTGNLNGDGVQHIVYHDGTDLISAVLSGATLSNTYARAMAAPDLISTGGNMKPETYTSDSVVTYTASKPSNNLVYYTPDTATFSGVAFRTRSSATDMGLGNLYASSGSDDEIGLYDTDNTRLLGYSDAGAVLSAGILEDYDRYADENLMDFQHLNISGGIFEDSFVGFSASGAWLMSYNGSTRTHLQSLNVSAGNADEALFLVAGDVNSFAGDGPDDVVIYRKDGTVNLWTANGAGFSNSLIDGAVGTGVTEMLIGDVLGDSLEEMVVSKGDLIEVWSLAGATPSLQTSYSTTGVLDFALGDMDGDGKQDIIAEVLVPTASSLILIR